jgi:hypothetical protein
VAVWHPERTVRARTCISSATTRPGAVWAKEDEEGALSESRCRRRDACCCTVDGCVGVQHCQERRRTGRKERHHGVRHNIRDDVEANEYFALKRNSICNRRVPRSRLVHRSLQLLLQSRHVLARLGLACISRCQNVKMSATQKSEIQNWQPERTRRSGKSWIIGGGDRRWEHHLSLILA